MTHVKIKGIPQALFPAICKELKTFAGIIEAKMQKTCTKSTGEPGMLFAKPSQAKPSQAKPSQAKPSQAKPS